jgi:hypothetical protein
MGVPGHYARVPCRSLAPAASSGPSNAQFPQMLSFFYTDSREFEVPPVNTGSAS